MSRGSGWSWLVLLGCSPRPAPLAEPPPAPRTAEAPACSYTLRVREEPELVIEGDVACRGVDVDRFEAVDPTLAGAIEIEPLGAGRARYRARLDALARRARSADLALRAGRSLLAPAGSFLPRPVPEPSGVPVDVRVQLPPGMDFETGLSRAGGGYRLTTHEIAVATYSVFGSFERSAFELPRFAGGSARVELVQLDAPAPAPRLLRDWAHDSARAVSELFRGFPVPRVLVVVVPVPRRSGVSFGKLLPESAPAIVVYVGEHTPAEKLARDWVLVHELIHLGVPSFDGEGKWFDEGLATYLEPIARHRAGLLDDRELWQELGGGLALGAAALARHGIGELRSYRELYWGGALICFLADVEARRRSGGRRGLEDGLRRVLARGGHASEVWALSDVLATVDGELGGALLTGLAQRHRRPHALALSESFEALGIRSNGGATELSDAAPLAGLRRALERGAPADPGEPKASVPAGR